MKSNLSKFEIDLIEKIKVNKDNESRKGKMNVNWLKIFVISLLFPIAYIFKDSFLLIPLLLIFWISYVTLSLAYAKMTALYSDIIFKLSE